MSTEPRTIGRCELFGRIARGGMATVHLARLKGAGQFSKTVAIKRMDERLAQNVDFVTMFLDEAALVARVRHPNVVSTLDLIQEGDELLIVMEYVEGVTLKHLTRVAREKRERVPTGISVSLIAGALRGLHAAHEATGEDGEPLGIVHRDLSPDNIIVGRDGHPQVIDFGVAKALDRASTTSEGELKGKLSYMAPEQAAGEVITRRADVFMASIVLWELLTGKRLFKGKSPPEIIYQLVSDDTPLASDFAPDLPADVVSVVARGLARDPAERWATALEMADALQDACPRVSPTDISVWVRRLASDRLDELATLVREMESAPRTAETKEVTQVAMTSSAPQRQRASRNVIIVGGMLVAAALGGAAVVAARAGDSASTTAGTTSASATAPPAASSAAPASLPSTPPSAKAADPPPVASSAKATPTPPPRLPTTRPPNARQPRPRPPKPPSLYGIE